MQSFPTERQLLGMSDEEIAAVDPVVMNLVVAKGISALADLDIAHYVAMVDEMGRELSQHMRRWEEVEYYPHPQEWNNDLAYFRLGVVCWYVDTQLGIAYKEDQREATRVHYTDPTDLFINGVLDTRRGTCGNMTLLHVALGRRLGYRVSLACIGFHFVCRYDDGAVVHNIETTNTGKGGFSSPTDEQLLDKKNFPWLAQQCGSDLCSVSARQMLGLFIGARARHYDNTERWEEADVDYLLARHLFPTNRGLSISQSHVSTICNSYLFEPQERGHPKEFCDWINSYVWSAPWKTRINPYKPKENPYAFDVDQYFTQITVG